MTKINEAATEFPACGLVAVTGSRGSPRNRAGTSRYERLRRDTRCSRATRTCNQRE
jgi:hypothetical protein